MRDRIPGMSLTAMIATMAFASFAVAQDLPDAETILDRYVEVTGGIDAYEDRRSQIVHGTMEIAAAGLTGPVTIYQQGDDHYTAIDLPGVGLIESGAKDGVAWENSALMGARIKSGTERAQAIRDGTMNASARWRELFPEVETVGVATIDGEEAYEVVMTPEEGGPQTTYFSVESGLALRTDLVAGTQMGDIPLQVTLGDYRDLDGILTATTMTQNVAGQTLRMTFDSVETNAEVPAGRFDLPEPVAALVE